jgi:hexosaminidase
LPDKILVAVPGHDAEDEFAARDLEDALKRIAPAADESHAAAQPPYRITLLRSGLRGSEGRPRGQQPRLRSRHGIGGLCPGDRPHEAAIIGGTGAGVFYGVQTFKQLLPLPGAPRVLATGTVRDWPAMKYRGISDDLSRGPFPTLDFQKHQIRVFAAFKINIYSPYFEHTLLYPDHPLAAPPGGSLTPAEVAELVAYARQYHITIVPEQEAFGHLHHVLKYELYQDEAETPHGYVLAPGQDGTLPLIKDWFTTSRRSFPRPSSTLAPTKPSTWAWAARTKRSRNKATGRCTSLSSSRFTTSSRRSIAACFSGATLATPIPTPLPACPKT